MLWRGKGRRTAPTGRPRTPRASNRAADATAAKIRKGRQGIARLSTPHKFQRRDRSLLTRASLGRIGPPPGSPAFEILARRQRSRVAVGAAIRARTIALLRVSSGSSHRRKCSACVEQRRGPQLGAECIAWASSARPEPQQEAIATTTGTNRRGVTFTPTSWRVTFSLGLARNDDLA